MLFQPLASGLMAMNLLCTTLASSPDTTFPAPDSIAYGICETHPEGGKPGELAPCDEVRIMEDVTCKVPQGTENHKEALRKQKHCLCNGKFFELKQACHRCIEGHAGISEERRNFFDTVLLRSYNKMCLGDTPPDVFGKIWLDQVESATEAFPGATSLVNIFGTSTDVSLYYTAHPQTPGPTAVLTPAVKLQTASPSPTYSKSNGTASESAQTATQTASETKTTSPLSTITLPGVVKHYDDGKSTGLSVPDLGGSSSHGPKTCLYLPIFVVVILSCVW